MSSMFACCNGRNTGAIRGDPDPTGVKPNEYTAALAHRPKGSPPPPPPTGGPNAEKMCGVGVVFKPTVNAEGGTDLLVYSVAPMSPAERSGRILPDDQLILAPLVLGVSGSVVTLRFKRAQEEFDVALERSWGSKKP